MYTIGDMVKELEDTDTLLVVRRDVGTDTTRLQHNLIAALSSKLLGIKHFATADALTVSTAVGVSQLPATAKEQLLVSIDDRLAGKSASVLTGSSTHHPSRKSPPAQLLVASNRYLTTSDWNWLRDARHDNSKKLLIIVLRYRRLGIRCLDEQTKRWVITILAQVLFDQHGSWPSYDTLYEQVVDFTKLFEVNKHPYGLQTILEYPLDPSDLPTNVHEYAYSPDDQPVFMHIDNFTAISRHIPLRSTSNLLSWNQRGPMSARSSGGKITYLPDKSSVNRRSTGGWYGSNSLHGIRLETASYTPSPLAIQDVPRDDGMNYDWRSAGWGGSSWSVHSSPRPSRSRASAKPPAPRRAVVTGLHRQMTKETSCVRRPGQRRAVRTAKFLLGSNERPQSLVSCCGSNW